jgi:hypothetical protein
MVLWVCREVIANSSAPRNKKKSTNEKAKFDKAMEKQYLFIDYALEIVWCRGSKDSENMVKLI